MARLLVNKFFKATFGNRHLFIASYIQTEELRQ